MKRGTKLLSLAAVLVVLIAAAFAVNKLIPEDGGSTEEEESVSIFTLETGDATALAWEYGGESLSFLSSNDGWIYAGDSSFPLNTSYIDKMLQALSEIRASRTIEAPEDLEQYGLSEPVCTITVTAGETTELRIGDETGMGGERYLSLGDGNVYLVDEDILDSFAYGLYDLVKKEVIPSMEEVTSFQVESKNNSYCLKYLENSGLAYSDSYVWFMDNGGAYQTLDTELTESLLQTVTNMKWKDCVNYKADKAALVQYGLDEPAATVTVNYRMTAEVETNEKDSDGNAVTETVTTQESFVLELGSASGSSCYARLAGSEMVYLVSGDILDTLLYTSSSELQPDEVLVMDWDEVTGVVIELDGETYALEKITRLVVTGGEDGDGEDSEESADSENEAETVEETVYRLDGEDIAIEDVLERLTEMDSTGYSGGIAPERGCQIRFVLERDTEAFAQVELCFYAYDSSSCLVTLNGESTVFVAREDVVDLVEAVNALVLG